MQFGVFVPQGWKMELVTTDAAGVVAWCADDPDTETLELLARDVVPNFR
jgi:hypothetical protein